MFSDNFVDYNTGIEVQPGKKVDPYEGHDTSGRLRITQVILKFLYSKNVPGN